MRKLLHYTRMMVGIAILAGMLVAPSAQAAPSVKVGDYIRFAKYYNAPILWRVIHIDASGDALLLSDRILTFKAFDARGSFHNNPQRRVNGSNNWLNSNIRQWLNSSSANSGTARINWTQNDPTKANMKNGDNAYATEKGFLADGNFTAAERNLIKPVTAKIVLPGVDAGQKDGGTEMYMFDSKLATITSNYDKAYYKNATDRVFLLTTKQLKTHVFDRRAVLGQNYHIAKPTSAAVQNSSYKNPMFLSSNLPWYYWLNTPNASTADDVRFVFSSGGVGSNPAALDNSGIRPALYLKVKAATFLAGGKGTGSQPYVVSTSAAPSGDKQAPTVPTNVKMTAMTGSSMTVQWSASRDNVALGSYEVFLNDKLFGRATNTRFQFTNLTNATAVNVKIRAVDRAGNRSAFSVPLRTSNTIQLMGNRVFVNFKRVQGGADGTPIVRSGTTLVPGNPLLQAVGLRTQWNPNRRTLTASRAGYTISFTVGSRTALINNKASRSMTVAPLQVKGSIMIPLSFVASQLGYKLQVK